MFCLACVEILNTLFNFLRCSSRLAHFILKVRLNYCYHFQKVKKASNLFTMECLITDTGTVRAQDTTQTEDDWAVSKCLPQLCSEIKIRQKSCEINKTGQ